MSGCLISVCEIIIQRSYAHSLEQLTSLNYFTQEQINFIDSTLIKMLKDIAFDVAKRKCKKKYRTNVLG